MNTCPDFFGNYKEEEDILEKNEIIDEEKNTININEIQNENSNIENNDENVKNFDEDLNIKKSESMSVTTQDTNNTFCLELSHKSKSFESKNDYNKEKEIDNIINNDDNNLNINSDINNKSNNKQKKKKEKEQKLFLYDTVKKKEEKAKYNNQ